MLVAMLEECPLPVPVPLPSPPNVGEKARESATPVPVNLSPQAVEIACAHPWAVARHLRPAEVSATDVVTIVQAIRDEARDTGVSAEVSGQALLQFTRSYADAVALWPPGDQRFMLGIGKFFTSREYRNDPQTWRRDAANQQPGNQSGNRTRTPAEQRHRDGLADILPSIP
jgi:hypothetical protein